MSGGLDLSRPWDVLRYLAGTPFASSRVEPLSGGTANYIFRLHLERRYEGMQTLVLKHGKGMAPRGQVVYSFFGTAGNALIAFPDNLKCRKY